MDSVDRDRSPRRGASLFGPFDRAASAPSVLMPTPFGRQGAAGKALEEVIGKHINAKEHGVGLELPAGQALHAEANFELFYPILAGLAALAISGHCRCRALAAVAGNDGVAIRWALGLKELTLAPRRTTIKRKAQ
jgi:hypothetical protein